MAGKVKFVMTGGRWFMLGTAAVGIFIVAVYMMIGQTANKEISEKANIVTKTDQLDNISGAETSNPLYAKRVKDDNERKAEQALHEGETFVSTLVLDKVEQSIKEPIKEQPQNYSKPVPSHVRAEKPSVWQRPPVDLAVVKEIEHIADILSANRTTGQAVWIFNSPPIHETREVSDTSPSSSGVASGALPKIILPAGEMIYGVFQTRLQSDIKGPVLGTLIQGKWRNYKVLGEFTRVSGFLAIRFNVLVDPEGRTYPIKAYAIHPETTLPAMATEVDRHILERFAGFMGAAFLGSIQGYGEAISRSGSTTVTNGLTTTTTEPTYTTEDLWKIAAGEAVRGLQPVMSTLNEMITQPNTIIVHEGTPFVLLVVEGAQDKNT